MAEAKVDVVALQAKRFSDIYYHLHDHKRERLVAMYKPDAIKVWNGTPAPVTSLVGSLPGTLHKVDTIDAQAVGGDGGFSVVINGSVKFGVDDLKHRFTQTFLLESTPSSGYMITCDTYRMGPE